MAAQRALYVAAGTCFGLGAGRVLFSDSKGKKIQPADEGDAPGQEKPLQEILPVEGTVLLKKENPSSALVLANGSTPARYGLPSTENLQVRTGYVSSVNFRTKVPNWVIEHMNKGTLVETVTRESSRFIPDESIPLPFRAQIEDYARSGYSRGHLAPAGAHKLNLEDMNATFLLSSNIVPQELSMNGADWLRLETFTRDLAKKYDHVYVVSGPLWVPSTSDTIEGKPAVHYPVIGTNQVAVPTHLFKAVLVENEGGKDRAVGAFVMKNGPIVEEVPLASYQVPLEDLQKQAGLTFFEKVPLTDCQDLCAATGCEFGSSKRIREWRNFGRIKAATTRKDLERAWGDAEAAGFEQPWVRDMYRGEYTTTKTRLDLEERRRLEAIVLPAAALAAAAGVAYALGRLTAS